MADRTWPGLPLSRTAGQRAGAFLLGLVLGGGGAGMLVIGGRIWGHPETRGGELAGVAPLIVLGVVFVAVGVELVRIGAAPVPEIRFEPGALVLDDRSILNAPLRIPLPAIVRVDVGNLRTWFAASNGVPVRPAIQLTPFPEIPNVRIVLDPPVRLETSRRNRRILTRFYPARPPLPGDEAAMLWLRVADPVETHRALFNRLGPGRCAWVSSKGATSGTAGAGR